MCAADARSVCNS